MEQYSPPYALTSSSPRLPPKPPRTIAPPSSDFPDPALPRESWALPGAEDALRRHREIYSRPHHPWEA